MFFLKLHAKQFLLSTALIPSLALTTTVKVHAASNTEDAFDNAANTFFWAVSYTHLSQYPDLLMDALPSASVHCMELLRYQHLQAHSSIPVSYTHLDVYKRQSLYSQTYQSSPASSSFPDCQPGSSQAVQQS